ncbi:PP2C family protein-serine/threonine phosphatase [Butyrivibrio proteoclasticus]|uniref:PP2C family protein-serine/threonine phosphatase n=1 Tax=Butyrivibrio proteoclasticus TaxID=43305 RepID=UPI00047B4DB6|nr:protein phosphatase 2C domain-containing protein [Butyrivibrio proteoclasticus]
MKVKACIYTDAGTKSKINRDAALVKVAATRELGRISFVAVCDGGAMGAKGEVASCMVIRSLETWFHEELPLLVSLSEEKLMDTIEKSWKRLYRSIRVELDRYGRHRKVSPFSTLTALLQIGKRYLYMNVGNSRIYLTDRGDMSMIDVPCQQEKELTFVRGSFNRNTTVVACSDGFFNRLDTREIYQKLCPQMCVSASDMLGQCRKLAMRAMDKKEEDNISVAALSLEF